ncbi:MAG: PEGA domain-containing protein [Acidobacteriota bacterium]
MNRATSRMALLLAGSLALAWLATGVASAQTRPTESQDPPRTGGERVGSAVPRGGGGPGPGAGPRAGGAPPPTTSGGGASSGGAPPPMWGGNTRPTDSQAGTSRGRERTPQGSDPPWYSRPRGNNPAIGTVGERGSSGGGRPPVWPTGGGGWYPGYYPPGYYPPNYWNSSYWYGYGAFGLGYFYYDPYWWGYGAPAYGGYGYGGYGGYGSYGGYGYEATGSLRLKVSPREANVFVDGYYAGRVDDFDGIFQRLKLKPGPHKIEISAPGYAPLVFDVDVRLNDTITYEGVLEPIR